MEDLIIINDDIDELLEEIHKSDKFDIEIGIEDDDISKNISTNSDKSGD